MMTMTGAMMKNGTRISAAKIGTVNSTRTTATTLPRYIEAINPQTKSFCSTNSIGPGFRPQIIRPPIMTAAVADPGTPSDSIGSSALVPACERKIGANPHGTPHCRDVDEDDTGPETCDVTPATRTASPVTSVSGGLLIIRSDGVRPARTSTLSPRSRPSFTLLRLTLLLLSRVATWVP